MSQIYTIIDMETTGVGSDDRIVEIGMIQFDTEGRELRSFDTLVQPEQPVPNTSLHGIDSKMLERAPTFAGIIDVAESFLSHSDLVMAFNINLDWRMLQYEFSRLKRPLPTQSQLCLTDHFRKVAPRAPRRIKDLCSHYDVELKNPHHSLSRVRAVHEVLCQLPAWLPAGESHVSPSALHKRVVAPSWTRNDCRNPARITPPILERLTSRLPRHKAESSFDTYFELLDDVFADSKLEPREALALFLLASELGMTQDDTERAHRAYVQGLLQVAYQDGFYTEMEAEHLESVAKALKIDDLVKDDGRETPSLYPRDLVGKSTCFSGRPKGTLQGQPISRSQLLEFAREAGITVKSQVEEGLDFLVVTDPQTASQEMRLSKELKIPFVSEQVFWNWLGVQVL